MKPGRRPSAQTSLSYHGENRLIHQIDPVFKALATVFFSDRENEKTKEKKTHMHATVPPLP